jgi:hypothetical protein
MSKPGLNKNRMTNKKYCIIYIFAGSALYKLAEKTGNLNIMRRC